MAKLLPNSVIQMIYKAAVAARLDRNALLAGLPMAFVGTLVRTEQASAQLLTDLLRLNQVDRLDDATVPLREWLEAAELLAGPIPEAAVFREALRQLNEAKLASAAPPHAEPRAVDAGPRAAQPVDARARALALHRLLLAMYGAEELRRLIRYLSDGSTLEAALPGPTASMAALVAAVVEVLVQRSAIDGEFFDVLLDTRPRRAVEIQQVRQMFLG